ncbi:cytochrome P450 [Lapillicoccus jejuensis]|uniref:Cytochrome P450 n=1 Tax=Lapillicoccus jejuensis TaxID=402171 RepID=A0A542DXE6_9MICO|nr:cytochrome P450 [Lapillicoccus jejuensis]TQJ07745.1 hypothetical protein FB458_0813 [Lapillicoccus jejuensis]
MALPTAAAQAVRAPVAPVQRRLRWVLQHGVLRYGLARGTRAGNVAARVMYDPAVVADPYAAYEHLRGQARLVSNGLVRSAHDHDLVAAVLRSPDVVTIGGFRPPPLLRGLTRLAGRGPAGPVEKPSLLAVDGLDHARMRKIVIRSFSAKAVARLRTRTEAIAADLLDGLEAAGARGGADLVRDYAGLLPATVIAEMLGAPTDMRAQFLHWGAGAAFSLDPGMVYPDFRRSEKDIAEFERWMRGHVERVRRDPVPGTILADLVAASDEQGALDDTELVGVAMLLLAAGFETTVNLIGNAVVLLLADPDQLALLREHPEHWENAVDEALRLESPVQRTARAVVRDTEVAGEQLRAGQLVGLVLAAANRDPRVFEDPARFDVTRANAAAHLAFSGGPHYCLGAGLARMEAEVALRALLDRFPDLALDGPPRRRRTRVLRGYDAMPVRLRG